MPGAYARTATQALTNVTLPYIEALAMHGLAEACRKKPGLAEGVNVFDGNLACAAVADGLRTALHSFRRDMTTDTIIALSTPPGVGALAVIRLSGPASRGIVEAMLAAKIDWQPRQAFYRTLTYRETLLDDVVLTFWRAPHSFTGEDTVEISCHGNPRIVEAIIRAALELGARAARPGEFTQRAFLNDRLSLTQAEGLLDLLYAPTERALASARAMKEGRLGEALEAARAELVDLLSHLEASLDFAEEGIEPRVGR